MKVIGIRKDNFIGREGNRVSGYSLFCSFPINKDGQGIGAVKIFLSDKKIAACGYIPELDDEINVRYNRWGKVEAVVSLGQ